MSYTIRPATEADAPELANINIASFSHQALWSNLFPSTPSTSTTSPSSSTSTNYTQAHPLKTARCLAKLLAPHVHVLVAIDNHTEKIVGYARWAFPTMDPEISTVGLLSPSNEALLKEHADGKAYPEGMRVDVYEAFWALLKDKQGLFVGEGDFVLEFLATLPSAQGKGVGTALLQWGIEQADKRNARVYLEATTDGYALYQKYGWRDLEVMELDFTAFGGVGSQKWFAMMRERGGVVPAVAA
ncbi:acyl-CoA N-acyltransferase [Aspergillus sclerotiicarbonarius CBS 121057]|uniref:Acyl-CoA N-acyltransferase n=1 Tax=Aspergillus sclerotiicarbonarius (strain CBS 121057 / IBT 28362) TaxID=1448318 RepID=A0A319EAJ7_ASPSB|nr:acyl-CoA N-acyltransferase [Aspergillus sclerotiicarbonarius CBS 121057]